MNTSSDIDRTSGGARRCTAHRTDGERCNAPALNGTNVCRVHGGKAPQVQRAARLKLLDLIDPAIATLAREMTNQQARAADRIKAAEAILDRAGHPRAVQVTGEEARELLRQRVYRLVAEQAASEQEAVVDQARQIIAGETDDPDSDADGGEGVAGDPDNDSHDQPDDGEDRTA